MRGAAFILLWLAAAVLNARAQRQLEYLSRGVVAVPLTNGGIFVSWRLLATDADDVAFDVYRGTQKLNSAPLREATSFIDSQRGDSYSLVAKGETNRAIVFTNSYLAIPLQLPTGCTPNDGSAGDLDGDGDYEIVLKSEQRPRDTASTGLTGETILQGYKLTGELMWTINLGKNIREGAHYTQFVVMDLDGDGIAGNSLQDGGWDEGWARKDYWGSERGLAGYEFDFADVWKGFEGAGIFFDF
jgi:rhamnogalacturonan endolyase